MLITTRREMERAFRTHCSYHGLNNSSSHRLLLVYAVECGLKALIMQDRRVNDTQGLAPDYDISHDLREGLKLVRAPRVLAIRRTITKQKNPQNVFPKELHQAFRYGIHIEDEPGVVDDLKKVVAWLKEKA